MTTKPRVTVKGIICNGIHNKWTTARILKEIAKKKPESKADESQVKYYSGQLKRAGEIPEELHRKYAGKHGRPSLTPTKAVKAVKKEKAVKKAVKKAPAKKTITKKVKKSKR